MLIIFIYYISELLHFLITKIPRWIIKFIYFKIIHLLWLVNAVTPNYNEEKFLTFKKKEKKIASRNVCLEEASWLLFTQLLL